MRILYLTPFKIEDNVASSGTVVSVRKALVDAGNQVTTIDNLKVPILYSLTLKIISKITGKHIDVNREPYVLKHMAKEIEKRAINLEYDVVFSQTSILCAYYRGDKKIVFYTDASFGGMMDYYWNPNEWLRLNIKHGNTIEEKALKNCSRAIYASQWAADTAVKCHGASPEKCVVINRGANIYHKYTAADIKKYILNRDCVKGDGPIKFLFVGRDWVRKGGSIILDTVKMLNDEGIASKIIIVGCNPDIPGELSKYVEKVGYLNKAIREENERLQNLFLTSDFYFQPSRQECQGIAYTEASAFGLPVIATDTGGVSGAVTEHNGRLLSVDATAKDYTAVVKEYYKKPDKYIKLAEDTFEFYCEYLNWNSVGKRLTQVLEDVLREGQ